MGIKKKNYNIHNFYFFKMPAIHPTTLKRQQIKIPYDHNGANLNFKSAMNPVAGLPGDTSRGDGLYAGSPSPPSLSSG
jgi:hypothetical protein